MNWMQLKAAGRHLASYAAGGVTVLVAWHFLSPVQGTDITTSLNSISSGIEQVIKGITGLLAVLTPIYTAWRASKAASPSAQIKSVIDNLSAPQITQEANKIADPASRNKLIDAVAEMPEVKVIKADEQVALATGSPKVVK